MKKYLEFKDEKSHKFWQIETISNSFTVTYGKIDSKGQTSTKKFDSEEKCLKEAEKLMNQKLKKGYMYVESDDTKHDKKGTVKSENDIYKFYEKFIDELESFVVDLYLDVKKVFGIPKIFGIEWTDQGCDFQPIYCSICWVAQEFENFEIENPAAIKMKSFKKDKLEKTFKKKIFRKDRFEQKDMENPVDVSKRFNMVCSNGRYRLDIEIPDESGISSLKKKYPEMKGFFHSEEECERDGGLCEACYWISLLICYGTNHVYKKLKKDNLFKDVTLEMYAHDCSPSPATPKWKIEGFISGIIEEEIESVLPSDQLIIDFLSLYCNNSKAIHTLLEIYNNEKKKQSLSIPR